MYYETILSALGLSLWFFTSCGGQKKAEVDFIQDNIDNAVAQNTIQTDIIENPVKSLIPVPLIRMGTLSMYLSTIGVPASSPGNIWHMYELTGDQKWLPLAEKYTEDLDSVQYLTWHHDVGL